MHLMHRARRWRTPTCRAGAAFVMRRSACSIDLGRPSPIDECRWRGSWRRRTGFAGRRSVPGAGRFRRRQREGSLGGLVPGSAAVTSRKASTSRVRVPTGRWPASTRRLAWIAGRWVAERMVASAKSWSGSAARSGCPPPAKGDRRRPARSARTAPPRWSKRSRSEQRTATRCWPGPTAALRRPPQPSPRRRSVVPDGSRHCLRKISLCARPVTGRLSRSSPPNRLGELSTRPGEKGQPRAEHGGKPPQRRRGKFQ